MNKELLTISVKPKVRDTLVALAKAQGVSRSQLADRILENFISRCDADLASPRNFPPVAGHVNK